MKKIITLLILTISLFACNNSSPTTRLKVEITNQHRDKDTMFLYVDTIVDFNKSFHKGIKLEDGNIYNKRYETLASGVYKYQVLDNTTYNYKSQVIDLPKEYITISRNPNYPDTMIVYNRGDTLHFKPSKSFYKIRRN